MKHRGTAIFVAGFLAALALGWFAFPALLYESRNQPFDFSHKVHTGESIGMTCEDCHTFSPTGSFTGIPRLEKCAGCHAQAVGTTEAEKILVEEYVTPNKEIPWLVYSRQPQNAYFSHIQHVKVAGLECASCHGSHGSSDHLKPYQVNRISGYSRDIWGRSIGRIVREPGEGMKMDDCARCHRERGVKESCLMCHK